MRFIFNIKRALHYRFNGIRFFENSKLFSVITKKFDIFNISKVDLD